MNEGVPGGGWPLPPERKDNQVELAEKREKITAYIQQFVKDEKFTGMDGNPVLIEKIVWPTADDAAASIELKKGIVLHAGHPLVEAVQRCVDYLDAPAVFDTLHSHAEHHIRRKIEGDLKKLHIEKESENPQSEEALLLGECEQVMKQGRLSRNHYIGLLTVMRIIPLDYSEETKTLFEEEDKIFPESEAAVGEKVNYIYDTLSEEEKEELSKKHAVLAASFGKDVLRAINENSI